MKTNKNSFCSFNKRIGVQRERESTVRGKIFGEFRAPEAYTITDDHILRPFSITIELCFSLAFCVGKIAAAAATQRQTTLNRIDNWSNLLSVYLFEFCCFVSYVLLLLLLQFLHMYTRYPHNVVSMKTKNQCIVVSRSINLNQALCVIQCILHIWIIDNFDGHLVCCSSAFMNDHHVTAESDGLDSHSSNLTPSNG